MSDREPLCMTCLIEQIWLDELERMRPADPETIRAARENFYRDTMRGLARLMNGSPHEVRAQWGAFVAREFPTLVEEEAARVASSHASMTRH